MVRQYIKSYNDRCSALHLAIDRDDSDRIVQLDSEVEDIWSRIASYQTENEDEIVALIEFYLEIIAPQSEAQGMKLTSIERIESLVAKLRQYGKEHGVQTASEAV